MLDSTKKKKDIPHIGAKEKPQQDSWRVGITFRIKLHTCQRSPEGSNKLCVHQDPETLQRLSQNCVWVSPVEVWVTRSLPQGQGLWVQQIWVWHKPSWRRSPVTSPQSCQNLHRTGKYTLGGHKQKLAHQDPGERNSDPTRDWPRLACECPGASSGCMGQCWPAAGLGYWVQQCLHGTFWRRSPSSSLPPPEFGPR